MTANRITRIVLVIFSILMIQSCHKKDTNIMNLNNNCNENLYWQAMDELESENYCSAIKDLEKFNSGCNIKIKSNTTYPYTYFMLGYSYEKIVIEQIDCIFVDSNATTKSCSFYNQYLNQNLHCKYRGRAYEGLVRMMIQNKNFQSANNILDKALIEFPNMDSLYRMKGNIYLTTNKIQESINLFKKAIELNPRNTWNYTGLGSAFSLEGEREKALESYNTAILLDQNNKIAKNAIIIINNLKSKP